MGFDGGLALTKLKKYLSMISMLYLLVFDKDCLLFLNQENLEIFFKDCEPLG